MNPKREAENGPDLNENRIFEFAEFSFSTREKILRRGEELVALPPKTCELLAALLENRGRLLTKEELFQRVWADAFVEDANLSHHIAVLRKALGETRGGEKFIETVPRRGYRFVSAVKKRAEAATASAEITLRERTVTRVIEEIEVSDDGDADAPRPVIAAQAQDARPRGRLLSGDQRRKGARFFVPLLLLLALAGVAAAIYQFGFQRAPMVKSVAVLPFKSINGEPADAYLQIGLADALITKLSGIKRVAFRPTSSILKFTDAKVSPAQAGRELGVDAVLEGLIGRHDDRLKVSVQLVRTGDGTVIWAESFDEKLTDLQNLQDSISEKITSALALELTGEEHTSIAKRSTRDAEAYQLYLRGRFQWFKFTPEGWQRAIDYFQQAIARDPQFAQAYSGLGYAYGTLGFAAPSRETYLKSKEASLKAIELDPTLAEAHALIGLNKFFYERDPAAARESLLVALRLSPNSALAHEMYAIYLAFTGQADAAIGEALKSVELDPLSAYMFGALGEVYYLARQPDKAIEAFKKSLELDPNYLYALNYLVKIYERKGQFADAENYREKALIAAGEREAADELRGVFAAHGYRAALEKRIEQLKRKSERTYISPMEFASIYVSLADYKRALEWLHKAYEEESFGLMFLHHEPHWDGLRADADFQNLLRLINQ